MHNSLQTQYLPVVGPFWIKETIIATFISADTAYVGNFLAELTASVKSEIPDYWEMPGFDRFGSAFGLH